MAKLDDNRSYITEAARTAAEIEAMTTGEEDEHDAKAASERPSSSQKASTLSGKQKTFIELQTVHEKDYDSCAEEEERMKNMITRE